MVLYRLYICFSCKHWTQHPFRPKLLGAYRAVCIVEYQLLPGSSRRWYTDVRHAANMCASVTLTPTSTYPNKKLCKANHQMARVYDVIVHLPDSGTVIEDEITFQDKGAGRNCFFFKTNPLVLKEFVVDEKHTIHADEMKIYKDRLDLRPFIPKIWAHCQTEAKASHSGYTQVLDVLIVEKAGASVKWLLESGFKDHDEAGRHFKLQSISMDVCYIKFVKIRW
jgi:hypothetical protein